MKKIALLLVLLTHGILFAGGEREDAPALPQEDRLLFVMPTGFPAIGMTDFIVDRPHLSDGVALDYEILKSPDLLGAKILSGEADLFIAPTNLGVNLYNKGVDLKYLGSLVWGILYVVAQEDLTGWEDLRGREINMLGRGLTPDIVFRHLLKANGLDPEKDVRLNYVQNTSELAPAFLSGKAALSIMPEPALSMVMTKAPGTKILFDLQKEWAAVSASSGSYPQASLFIKADAAEKHPEFVSNLLTALDESVPGLHTDPEETGRRAASFLDSPAAPIIAKAIPRGNLLWRGADESKEALREYLTILLNSSPKTIGAALPDDAFYY